MKKKNYKLLSYFLGRNTPLYGKTKSILIKPDREIKKGDSCNTTMVTFSNHSGTHIDAPRHFYYNGRSISDFSISELIFNSPLVLECPKKENELIVSSDLRAIKKCDLLLIRTGFYRYRNNNKYRIHNPGISSEAAIYIRRKHPYVRTIGIDAISISAFQKREEGREAHKILLKSNGPYGQPICVIEDMDLSKNLKKLKKVYVAPLFLKDRDIDSMPCTIIGEFHE